MNDEEIMKKFNETFSNTPQVNNGTNNEIVEPYKTTTNYNNLNYNLNIPNNEIQPMDSSSTQVPNTNINNNDNINTNVNNSQVDVMAVDKNNYGSYTNNNGANYSNNVNYNYVPSYNSTKKKKTISIKISPEIKPVIIIVIILFVIIMIIPTVYDFFNSIS